VKQTLFQILSNRALTANVYELRLQGDTAAFTRPGQFLNLQIPGLYLRRPLSVCDWDSGTVTVIYKVVGGGTAALSRMAPGQTLDALAGLGNGFDTALCGRRTLLLGGGAGVPPLYGLAKALLAGGKTPVAVLGFNTAAEIFYASEFRALGVETIVATADGSAGVPGFVTDALPADYDYFCACGPLPMLRAVCQKTAVSGQLSFEERMGCGFGACMGCSIQTKNGSKRVCKDGPVLRKEEILW